MKYQKFHTPDEVKSWVDKYKSFFPSDHDEDKEFLQAIDYYTASANTQINNYLRYNKAIETDDFIYPYAKKLISKLPTYHIPDNIIVYRYISKELLKEMCSSYSPQKHMILHDKGFMSTTLLRSSVDKYSEGRKQNILLIISVPSGTNGLYVGYLRSTLPEYEVILAPDTKLRINRKIPFFNSCFWCTVI